MNYDRFPSTKINGFKCYENYSEIIPEILSNVNKNRYVISIDTYIGVDDKEVLDELLKIENTRIIKTLDFFKNEKKLNEVFKYNLTADRVFGRMFYGDIYDLIDNTKFSEISDIIQESQGLVIIYGFGAFLLESDLKIYFDVTRWEIQLRYRKGMPNYNCSNYHDSVLSKYKRGFFIEWRIADKHKIKNFDKVDYFVDASKKNNPMMITSDAMNFALNKISSKPFRTVPYFDPGVWGGQWMKNVFGLDINVDNYAWSFDGVPEENSLLINVDGRIFEMPALNLVLVKPKELLGDKVYSRFGAEFPIRFDLLDTIGGQNLSLQVHPTTEYAKKEFGIQYTQDESYYILDSKDDGMVYLGLKDNINKNEMINDLSNANDSKIDFDVDKYINKFPAKKHDHFLIPAGTCHCSGLNTMVLEISSTPYIFTFKLWDWNRLGLDGEPRPVHIEHGENVIQWNRTTDWIRNNLINDIIQLENNDNYIEEHTGLHELEFIETRRYWIKNELKSNTFGNLNMFNLVEGDEAIILSPKNSFEPLVVHYAETFIIPASVNEYIIRPYGKSKGKTIVIIKAYVKSC